MNRILVVMGLALLVIGIGLGSVTQAFSVATVYNPTAISSSYATGCATGGCTITLANSATNTINVASGNLPDIVYWSFNYQSGLTYTTTLTTCPSTSSSFPSCAAYSVTASTSTCSGTSIWLCPGSSSLPAIELSGLNQMLALNVPIAFNLKTTDNLGTSSSWTFIIEEISFSGLGYISFVNLPSGQQILQCQELSCSPANSIQLETGQSMSFGVGISSNQVGSVSSITFTCTAQSGTCPFSSQVVSTTTSQTIGSYTLPTFSSSSYSYTAGTYTIDGQVNMPGGGGQSFSVIDIQFGTGNTTCVIGNCSSGGISQLGLRVASYAFIGFGVFITGAGFVLKSKRRGK